MIQLRMNILTIEQYNSIRSIANTPSDNAADAQPEPKEALLYLRQLLQEESSELSDFVYVSYKIRSFFRIRPITTTQQKSTVDQIYTQLKQWDILNNNETKYSREALFAEFIIALFASAQLSNQASNIYQRFVDIDKAGIQELCQHVPTFQWEQRSFLGTTRLHSAAQEGDPRLVDVLIALGANVNATTITGATPLIIALENEDNDLAEHSAVIRSLLAANNINLEQRTLLGKTAIEMAVSKLEINAEESSPARYILNWVLLALHNKELDKDRFKDKIAEALRWATRQQDIDAVKQIMNAFENNPPGCQLASYIFNAYLNQPPPLESAVFDKNNEMFLRLFKYSHINLTPTTQDKNILLTAVRANHTENVREILNTERGKKLLPSAILVYYGKKNFALLIALNNFNKDIALLLLEHSNVGIDATDDKGNTPLHLSAKQGFLEVVEKLLDYHADANAKNNAGETVHSILKNRMNIKPMPSDDVILEKLTLYIMQNSATEKIADITSSFAETIIGPQETVNPTPCNQSNHNVAKK